MTKSTKYFDLMAKDLMNAWLKGWPEYAEFPADDNFSIIDLSKKVAAKKGLLIENSDDFKLVCTSITKIANYCKYSEKFAPTNLHFINRAFQTLYNKMAADKRIAMLRMTQNNYNYTK